MKKPGIRLLVSVAGRVTIFLYLFSLFIILLFIQGNFQVFLDESLVALMAIYRYSSLLYISAAVFYIFILITSGRGTGRRVGLRIILTAAGIIFSAAGFFITAVLSAAFQPVV